MVKHKFQVQLSGKWENYSEEENGILCRAYMSGAKKAQYQLRGQHYVYDFDTMEQINQGSGKHRKIRPPPHLRRPTAPLVPAGPTMMVQVPAHARAGDVMEVPHPQDKSVKLQVIVPPGARPGATLLVPVPTVQPAPLAVAPFVPVAVEPVAPAVPTPAAPEPTPAPRESKPTGIDPAVAQAQSNQNAMRGAIGGAGAMAAVGGVLLGVGAATGELGNVGDGLVDATMATGDAIGDGAQAAGEFMEPAIEELGEFATDAGDFIMNLF